MGGRQADEALAAMGQIRTQHEVLLAAGAADLAGTRRLAVDLTVQVHIHRIVDGDKVVDSRDGAHIVGIADRRGHAGGVVVQIVIELLGTGCESVDLTAAVDILTGAGDLSRHSQIHVGVHVHLRMYAQILQIGLAQHSSHGVGHAADAQLETGSVGDLLYDQASHRFIHIIGLSGRLNAHGVVAAFHHHVHLADVDGVVKTAQTAGHVLVDLHDDHLGLLADGTHMGCGQAEVEVAVAVHGRDLEHGHVRRRDVVVVVAGQLRIAHGRIEPGTAGDVMALHPAHVVGIENNVACGVLDIEDSRLPQADSSADLHILQFRCAAGQCLVQHAGLDGAEAVIHPIAGLDNLHRLIRGGQLLAVQFPIISKRHSSSSSFFSFS